MISGKKRTALNNIQTPLEIVRENISESAAQQTERRCIEIGEKNCNNSCGVCCPCKPDRCALASSDSEHCVDTLAQFRSASDLLRRDMSRSNKLVAAGWAARSRSRRLPINDSSQGCATRRQLVVYQSMATMLNHIQTAIPLYLS